GRASGTRAHANRRRLEAAPAGTADAMRAASVQTLHLAIIRIPVDRLAGRIDRPRARLGELIERFDAGLATDTAVLEAAPRRRRVEPVMVVHPHHAELELARHAMRARDVDGP